MRRVFIAITVVLAVVAAVTSLTILGWENTIGAWSDSVTAEAAAARSGALDFTFGQERPLMLRYLAAPAPGILARVLADHAQFARLAAQVKPATGAGGTALAAATAGGNAAFTAFRRAQPLAGADRRRALAAIGPLDNLSAAAADSLRSLVTAESGNEVRIRRQANAAASSSARFEAVSSALAMLLAIGFAWYVTRILRLAHGANVNCG